MIQPVEKIPDGHAKMNVREMIRQDILQAWESGIEQFELIGYPNYKYLQQYVRDVIFCVQRELIRKRYDERKAEIDAKRLDKKYNRLMINLYSEFRKRPFAKATSFSDEEKGKRVFCRIDKSMIDACLDALVEKENQDYEYRQELRRKKNEKLSAPE